MLGYATTSLISACSFRSFFTTPISRKLPTVLNSAVLPSSRRYRVQWTLVQRHKIKRWFQQPGGRGYRGEDKSHGPDTRKHRIIKTVSRIIRYDAPKFGLGVREDGYVKVDELLALPIMRDVDLPTLESVVYKDRQERFHLYSEDTSPLGSPIWWLGFVKKETVRNIEIDLQRIKANDVDMAVHGTTPKHWRKIAKQGISRMSRDYIHLGQRLSQFGVMAGSPYAARILIHVNLKAAIADGIPFYLTRTGVILTPGNFQGVLGPKYFLQVQHLQRKEIELCLPTIDNRQLDSEPMDMTAAKQLAMPTSDVELTKPRAARKYIWKRMVRKKKVAKEAAAAAVRHDLRDSALKRAFPGRVKVDEKELVILES